MANNRSLNPRLREQKGVALVIVAGALVMLVAFMAMSIDIGYVMISKNEVQNVADASALAGCGLLGNMYEGLDHAAQQTFVPDPNPIIDRAKTAAHYNEVARKNIDLADNEVEIGTWDAPSKTFTPTLTHPNAVRVTAHRDDAINGKIPTFFAKIMGIDSMGVAAMATAALTGQSTTEEDGLPMPIGISRYWWTHPDICNQPIRFYPANDPNSCAGWHVYDTTPASDSKLRNNIIAGLIDGSYTSPPTTAYVTSFSYTGGTLSKQTFDAFKDLFDAKKTEDGDGDDDVWTAAVPVYDADDCANPNQSIVIVGYSTVVITDVIGPPTNTIDGYVKCNIIQPGRGGGTDYGTMGSIPNLVQ